MKRLTNFLLATLFCFSTSMYADDAPTNLIGAGSSFIYPVMSAWAERYHNEHYVEVNYQSIGSGGGLQQLLEHTIQFAAVDMPQDAAMLNKNHWQQFPLVSGGIVIVVHLPHIKNNQLTLDGPTLAKMYEGKITHWNDPAIEALNPGLALPDSTIVVIHRADGSGTTYNFSSYLSAVDADWQKNIGVGTTVAWPTGIGGEGNTGVAMFVQRVPNSIGFVEYSFASETGLTWTQMKNADGHVVQPSAASFAAAASNVSWDASKNFEQLMVNTHGANSWPLMATTFGLVPHTQDATENSIHTFLHWCYTEGGQNVTQLGYVPMPASTVATIENYWKR